MQYKRDMLDAIIKEIELQKGYLQTNTITSLYLGGGTPSLLSTDEINEITDAIATIYDLNNLQEFTIETNPDDLSKNYILGLRDTLVNRFSIGIQSFFDDDLKYMNRAHNAQEADYAIKATQDAGFTNITVDLIYGTPGLSDEQWKQNIATVHNLGVPHLSAYALTVEEGTALHHNILNKKTAPVIPEQSAEQFQILMHEAEQFGFQHYEISNLAKERLIAVHNTNYWKGVPYLGIGPSAHSFDGQNRRWNVANNALYMKGILTKNELAFEEEELTTEQKLNEYIMTSLRTMWGLDLDHVHNKWGADYANQIEESSQNFIKIGQAKHIGNNIILTSDGKLFADGIAGELFF